MSNLFKNPSFKANLGYNGFDMSNTLKFSSTTGELLPIYYDYLQPGDKVNIKTLLKSRTLPLRTSAMTSVKERIEWFFVPMRYIYTIFEDWYHGIDDIGTSLIDSTALDYRLPYISGETFSNYLRSLYTNQTPDAMWPISFVGNRNNCSQLRLMECLGLPINNWLSNGNIPQGSLVPSHTPLLACAYQKIWFDYYRNSEFISNDPKYYNLDRFYQSPQLANLTAADFYTLRYRPRRKDFFTHLYSSPLMGSKSVGAFSENIDNDARLLDMSKQFNQWLASGMDLQTSSSNGINGIVSNPSTIQLYPVEDQTNPTQVTTHAYLNSAQDYLSPVVYNSLSPTQIRTSFAVQKLLEITRRAGKHWDAQTLAHFGVSVPKNINGEVIFLGKTCDNDIQIGDVISTAETSEQALGTIAGKGYNYSPADSAVKYEAYEHGIIMGLYSAEVVTDYNNLGFDRLNNYFEPSDWFRPEFENLGMQPMFRYQVNCDLNQVANWSAVYDWQYRWSELKCKYNKVIGAMAVGRTLQDWTTQQDNYNSSGRAVVQSFYCSPFDLDAIMVKQYEFGTFGDSYTNSNLFDSDPLIHELYIDSNKSSKMSTYGLEQL